VAATLGLADVLDEAPRTADELAALTSCDATSLRRVMRALCRAGVFAELESDRFGLTPVGSLLRETDPHSVRGLSMIWGTEHYRAWSEVLHSVRTGRPAFEHVYQMPLFAYYSEQPARGRIFDQAMTNVTRQIARGVVAAYDFSQYRTVIDVGGGHGTLLLAILRENEHLRGVVFDRPRVRRELATAGIAPDTGNRWTYLGGDFFESVPAGGDVYLLSQILHDWDDSHCVTLLERCRRVVPKTGRLLVVELLLEAGPPIAEWSDLHMLVVTGGRERTATEYGALLSAAGFNLLTMVPIPTGHTVLEAIPC
jgi:hypothetical protein